MYGRFPGGDPRLFTPDEGDATAEELARHARDCAAADAAPWLYAGPPPDRVVWGARPWYGYGTYKIEEGE